MNESFTHLTEILLDDLSEVIPPKLVVRNGFFITVVSDQTPEIENVTIRHRVSANGKALLAGVYDEQGTNSEDTVVIEYATIFAKSLLKQFRHIVGGLVTFSKKRDIGDRKLYQDIYFRQVVADILKFAELTELSLAEPEFNLKIAFQYLTEISHRCAKALGGRSLFAGSIFDLLLIGHLVEDTYVK